MVNKNKKFKFKISKIPEVLYDKKKLELDLSKTEDKILPTVSVITITKNRYEKMDMAIYNWKNFFYPKDKIEWIIVDDSDNNNLSDKINKLFDKRIKYFYIKNFDNIAAKRNFSVEKCKNDIIVHMDDDDYYYNDSIFAKVRCLQKYNKKCIFTSNLAVHNLNTNMSQNISYPNENPYIAEATMTYYRDFWENSPKFSNNINGEGGNMVKNKKQFKQLLNIPWFFNCICMTHKDNYTGSGRDLIIENQTNDDVSFINLLPDDVKSIISNW